MMSEYVNLSKSKRVCTLSTSKGDHPKFKINDVWYKIDKFGYEGFAEDVASKLLAMSTLTKNKFVIYNSCKLKYEGKVYSGCASHSFTDDNEEVITFDRILQVNGIDNSFLRSHGKKSVEKLVETIEMCTGLNVIDYLKDIITLDTIILNEDRHLNNLAVIYNRRTRTFRKCPIFDNGLSLLSDLSVTNGYPLNIPLTVNMNKVKPKLFGKSFDDVLSFYGPSFTIQRSLVESYLSQNRERLGRVYDLIDTQLDFYPEIFTESDVHCF